MKATLYNGDALNSSDPTPAVVFDLNTSATVDTISSILEDYLKDDVYTDAFLATAILHSASVVDVPIATVDFLRSKGAQTIVLKGKLTSTGNAGVKFTEADGAPAPGPYLALKVETGIELYPVYRLTVDRYRTFVAGVYAKGDGFEVLGKVTSQFGDPIIPVPSRLYRINSDAPLAGHRIAVKGVLLPELSRSSLT